MGLKNPTAGHDIFHLGRFAWEFSLWNIRFGTSALELALSNFRFETLARQVSVWGTVAWKLSLRNKRLDTFAWELWLQDLTLKIHLMVSNTAPLLKFLTGPAIAFPLGHGDPNTMFGHHRAPHTLHPSTSSF